MIVTKKELMKHLDKLDDDDPIFISLDYQINKVKKGQMIETFEVPFVVGGLTGPVTDEEFERIVSTFGNEATKYIKKYMTFTINVDAILEQYTLDHLIKPT